MPQSETEMRQVYHALQPGDRVEVVHQVKVGMRTWNTTTQGTVVGKERRRHSLHFLRNPDDKVWSDFLDLQLDDGQRTTCTIDEFTQIHRLIPEA